MSNPSSERRNRATVKKRCHSGDPTHSRIVNDVAYTYPRYSSNPETQGKTRIPPHHHSGIPMTGHGTNKHGFLRVIQILLLNYLGRADMEFLLTLGPGGGDAPQPRSPRHHTHTSSCVPGQVVVRQVANPRNANCVQDVRKCP